MRYLLCKKDADSKILCVMATLERIKYELVSSRIESLLCACKKEFYVLLDLEKRQYAVLSSKNDTINYIETSSEKIGYTEDIFVMMEKIGITDSIEVQTQKNEEYTERLIKNSKVEFSKNMENAFSKLMENEKKIEYSKKDCLPNTCVPKDYQFGDIFEMIDTNQRRVFGIVSISNGITLIFNNQIIGYIETVSEITDYKILIVRRPNKKYWKLCEYDKMPIVWKFKEEPKIVTKTIEEIEKELGLAPGSLKINM